jgi:hypothetical protein
VWAQQQVFFALWVTKLSNSWRLQQCHQPTRRNSTYKIYKIDGENDSTWSLTGKDIGDEHR